MIFRFYSTTPPPAAAASLALLQTRSFFYLHLDLSDIMTANGPRRWPPSCRPLFIFLSFLFCSVFFFWVSSLQSISMFFFPLPILYIDRSRRQIASFTAPVPTSLSSFIFPSLSRRLFFDQQTDVVVVVVVRVVVVVFEFYSQRSRSGSGIVQLAS